MARNKKSQTDKTDAPEDASEGAISPADSEQDTPGTETTPLAEDASDPDTVETSEDSADKTATRGSPPDVGPPDETDTAQSPVDDPEPFIAKTPEDRTDVHTSPDDAPQDTPEPGQPGADTPEPDIATDVHTPSDDAPQDTTERGQPEADTPGSEIAEPPEDTTAPEAPSGDAAQTTPGTESRGEESAETAASESETGTPHEAGRDPDTETAAPPERPEPDPAQDATPVVRTEQITVRKGGFWSMLTGGIVAAGIGVAAAPYILPYLEPYLPIEAAGDTATATPDSALTARLDDQAERISDLAARLDGLPPPSETATDAPDDGLAARLDDQAERISDLAAQLDGLPAPSDPGDEVGGLNERLTDLTERVANLEVQVTNLADRPAPEVPEMPDTAATEAAIDALRDRLAAQGTEIEELSAILQAEEEAARDSARATLQRAALTRVMTALDTGDAFAPALADLRETGVDVPDVLENAAETGVPTRADLVESFPDAARAALAAALAADADATASVGGFLRAQLGVRSLEPREGDDADAILSRAEAALAEGRLDDSLSEINTLPEEARAAMSDWAENAAARRDALAGAEGLSAEMN